MTKANDLASLLDANGDVVSSALDNVPASDLVNDTTPQLGGNLDLNSNNITGTGNVDVTGAISSNKGSAGTLATFTDGVNSNFVVETSSLLTTIGNGGGSAALALKANNTEAMRIDSGGDISFYEDTGTTPKFFWDASAERLGIGTNSPSASLEIEGTSAEIDLDNTSGKRFRISSNTDSSFSITDKDTNSERLRIDSSGNVGIGENAPVTPLTIATTNKLGSTFTGNINGEGLTVTQTDYTSGNYISLIEAAYDDSSDGNPNVRIGAMFDGSGANLAFGTSNSYGSGITNTAMFINSSGSVGINTSSPTSGRILDADGQVRFQTASTGRYFDFVNDSAASYLDVSHSLNIRTNGASSLATAMTLDSSGSVGLGTTSPTFLTGSGLEVSRSGTATVRVARTGATASAGEFFAGNDKVVLGTATNTHLEFRANNTERLRLTSAGKLCLGTTAPVSTAMITIEPDDSNRIVNTKSYDATTQYHFVFQNHLGANVGKIQVSTSATSFVANSDYRLKTDVTYDWDATTRLKQLKPARFKWIIDGDDAVPVDGFIAHEVQDIIPESISGTRDAMMDEEYEVTPAVLDDDGNEVTPAVMGTRSVPDYQGIDQSKVVPLLTKALIEAVEKIEQLEARITALETA